MFLHQNPFLINEKIGQFYKTDNKIYLENINQYFNSINGYNLKEISSLLWPGRDDYNEVLQELSSQKYKDFLQYFQKLLPIFQYSKIVLRDINNVNNNNPEEVLNLQWIGANIKQYCSRNKRPMAKTKTYENILLLTSILENALANVYYTKSQRRPAPHLLKDLIHTSELKDVFGIEMILFLKILMGTPNSINVRNIVWHGFPQIHDIPDYYEAVLLLTIHTMGGILHLQDFELLERSQITDFHRQLKNIESNLKQTLRNVHNFQAELQQIEIRIGTGYTEYWQQLFEYYADEEYIDFIVLILPQIELLLRLYYGQENNYDVSAKLDEYYITMDTIFEKEVMNNCSKQLQPNELLNFENNSMFEGCFHLLYDVFMSSNGCRLRDKISHGEVSLQALNNSQLATVVMHIFLTLLLTPTKYDTLNSYQTKYHLNGIVKYNLGKCFDFLNKFCSMHLPAAVPSSSPYNDFDMNCKILIFCRVQNESTLMLLIKKISENIIKTIENYEESLEMRIKLLNNRELHSKRRKTLEKLLNCLPNIFKSLKILCHAIAKIYMLLQQKVCLLLDDEVASRKSLK